MLKVIILIVIYSAACYGAPGKSCGEAPDNLYRCLKTPLLISIDTTKKCKSASSRCDRVNCVFRELKWSDGDAVDKVKFASFLTDFAKKLPEWTTAVEHAKTECLGGTLSPQGTDLNCPTIDITYCVYVSFIKNAGPSQWKTEESCSNARKYARSCPVCPTECFSPEIPAGSCNACNLRAT